MDNKMYCPFCGTTIDEGTVTCPVCGARLYDSADEGGDGDLTRQVDDDLLTYGTSNTYDSIDDTPLSAAVFAERADTMDAHSGGQTGTGPTPQPTPPQRGGRGVLIVLALIVALGAVGGLTYFGLRSGAGAQTKPSEADSPDQQTFTVSFETGGGERIESQKVEKGKQAFTPTDPVRSGYTFAGWYTSSDYTEKVTFPFEVTEDVVLFAKWEEVEPEPDPEPKDDPEPEPDPDPVVEAPGFVGIDSAYATSTLPVSDSNPGPYGAECVLDGIPQTCWSEGSSGNGEGESITLTGSNQTISGFYIRSGYQKISPDGRDLYYYNARPATIHVVANGETIHRQTLEDAGHTVQEVTFSQPVETSAITIVIETVYAGEYADCCISEIECF